MGAAAAGGDSWVTKLEPFLPKSLDEFTPFGEPNL